jgi:DNA polymerase/3'-5' exonuclease PolX
MKLAEAQAIAEGVRAALLPHCERCEIGGSIRRQRPEVGDVEIIAIPRTLHVATDLFGGKTLPVLDPGFAEVVGRWKHIKGSAHGRYTQRELPGIVLDLFICDARNWGLIFAIRTGSADWVRQRLACAWVRAGYKSQEGRLRVRTVRGLACVQETPDERGLFALIGLPWTEPQDREIPPHEVRKNLRSL